MPPADVDRALNAPAVDVGRRLAELTEDQWFDRKSARVEPRALGDALIAFANAEGGVVVIGIHDGEIEGTDSREQRRNDLMQAYLDFATPPVRAQSRLVTCVNAAGDSDHLLVIDVTPSDRTVHVNHRDEVLLRVGDENRRLSFAQRQELLYDRGQGSFEAKVLDDASMSDLDEALLQDYTEALGATDSERVLGARGLLLRGRLTIAGVLLFGKHPQALLPEALVRVLRYRGVSRGSGARQQLALDTRIEGPIPKLLQEARRAITEHQPFRRALGRSGVFEDMPIVPEDAWLEGLVNAVVHRSYSMSGDHIRVELFDDRIEITSPGRFPGLVDLSTPFDAPRFARNPRIARVAADLRFGQELGEGIRRIYEEMRMAGLGDPVYRQTAATVRLTLSGEPRDRELDAQFAPTARNISVALREAGRLGTGEIAEVTGRSRPFVLKVLRELETNGIVRWVGRSPRDPRAYWEFVRRKND